MTDLINRMSFGRRMDGCGGGGGLGSNSWV